MCRFRLLQGALVLVLLGNSVASCSKDIDEREAIRVAEDAVREYVNRHPGDPGGFRRIGPEYFSHVEGWYVRFCRVDPVPRYLGVFVDKRRSRRVGRRDLSLNQ